MRLGTGGDRSDDSKVAAPMVAVNKGTASSENDLHALEEFFWTLDFGPRHRVELLDGRTEVSPSRPTGTSESSCGSFAASTRCARRTDGIRRPALTCPSRRAATSSSRATAKCARAGIPFYLLADRFTEPMTITLMSEPGEQGYRRIETVPAGPDGGNLVLPAPFGITIDVSTVPEFRPAAGVGGQ